MQTKYDVIIIGSGAGGGTLARHLAPSGKSILILERGDWLNREQQNWNVGRGVHQEPLRLPRHLVRQDGEAFQPGVHYFVGGATKMLRRGALPSAQGRLRRARSTTTEFRRPGRSATTRWSLTTPRPSKCTRCTARAAKIPTEPPSSAPYPFPGGVARAAHPAAARRSRAGRLSSVPRALRHHAQRTERAVQRLHSLQGLRWLSVPGSCQIGRRSARACVRRLQYPNVTLLTDAKVIKLNTNPSGKTRD